MAIDPSFYFEVYEDTNRIVTIINSQIFMPQSQTHALYQSAFIELMIRLSDLLNKCKVVKSPVTFTDDVPLSPNIKNVTDLVVTIRNAVCHIPSKTHVTDLNTTIKFATVFGKATAFQIGELELKGEYEDDIRFFFGGIGIYLNRNIVRSFNEAQKNLAPFISEFP